MALSNRTMIVAVIAALIVIIVIVALVMSLGGNNNPPPSGGGNEVRITSTGYSFSFSPSSLTVHVGENVTWVNEAGADHDVVSDSAADPFNSGIMANGQSFTHQFDEIGEFPYHCSLHPYMTGTITVIA